MDFELRSDFIALRDPLKYCRVTETGGTAKHLITGGLASADGEVELRKRCKAQAGQVATGKRLSIRMH